MRLQNNTINHSLFVFKGNSPQDKLKDLSTNPKVKGYYGKLVEILEPIISQLIGREITVDEIAQLAKSTPQTAKTVRPTFFKRSQRNKQEM